MNNRFIIKKKDLDFQREWVERIENININSMMSSLVVGPSGSGKYTRIIYLLHRWLRLKNPCKLSQHKIVIKAESKKHDVQFIKSDHFVIFDFFHYKNIDKYVLKQFMDDYINSSYFIRHKKIIIIKNAHNMSNLGQIRLKGLLEKYYNKAIFILLTSQPSLIIKSLQQHLIMMRHNNITNNEVRIIYEKYIEKNSIEYSNKMKENAFLYITRKMKYISNTNSIVDLNYLMRLCLKDNKYVKHTYEFEPWIDSIIEYFQKAGLTQTDTLACRDKFYDLITKQVPRESIIHMMFYRIMRLFCDEEKYLIVEIFSKYTSTSAIGGRDIYYYEAIFWNCYYAYHFTDRFDIV
jgi:DNA polymerase III delta prime subunit